MPVLRLLHWLPVLQRVDFKVATLVDRSLSGNMPSYSADDCHLIADARERWLRSAEDTHVSLLHGLGDSFCSCRPRTMGQFTITSHRCRLIVQSVPAVTKDIFVRIVEARCSVSHLNCEIILLTLLFYLCCHRNCHRHRHRPLS